MTGTALATTRPRAAEPPGSIRGLATVTLDAQTLDDLAPATIDRLADLVASRLAERRAAGEEPLLSVREAAEIAGAHPETIRRAIRRGALSAAGYLGQRPRLRRGDIDEWVASGRPTSDAAGGRDAAPRRLRAMAGGRAHVLGDALRTLHPSSASGARPRVARRARARRGCRARGCSPTG